jgi:hypothetical protein
VPFFSKKADPSRRTLVSRSALERAITTAIKTFDVGCQDFVGVVVEQSSSKSSAEPNWQVKGLRFGKSDRDMATAALDSVLPLMQKEFTLEVSDQDKIG